MGYLKDKVRAHVATRTELEALTRDVRRLGRRTAAVPRLRQRVQRQGARLGQLRKAVAEQRRANQRLTQKTTVLRTDFERLAHQLAATETRIEWLRERIDPEVFDGTTEDRTEARRLIEEIRHEHAQVRVRFQVVSNYEERLSRVEKALSADR